MGEEGGVGDYMKILFLHGWHSVPGGVKPTYLKDHGHEVINPALDDDDFPAAVATAQAEFDQHQPQVVVGSSRGGAVAMNINIGDARLNYDFPRKENEHVSTHCSNHLRSISIKSPLDQE